MTRLLRHARQSRGPLAHNPAHRFAAAYALVCYPSDTVATFIPKNACSSLRLSLAIANGALAGPADWPWIHENNATFRASLRDLATARFTFVILRCPFARLASVFLDKIVGQYPDYWQIHRAMEDRLDPAAFTFRDFVAFVTGAEVEGVPALERNEHWRPQADFLVYETYDAWYAVEQMDHATADLAARGALELVDARALTRHGSDRFTASDDQVCADLPLTRIAGLMRDGTAPAHAALYDEDLVADVARAYAGDIALYRERIGARGLLFEQDLEKDQT